MQNLQKFIPLVYDIVTVVVFLYMIGVCARRGFVRTAAMLLGYAAALGGAAVCAKPLAAGVFQVAIRPGLVENIAKKLDEVQGELLPQNLVPLVEQFPQAIFDAVGLDKEQMTNALHEIVAGGGERAAADIADAIVAPLILSVLRLAFFLLIFAVASFFVHKLVGMFGGVNQLPLVGPANQVLGALMGVLQAALTMYVAAVSLGLVAALGGGSLSIKGIELAGSAVFGKTLLFKAFVDFNPLDMLLALQSSLPEGDIGHKFDLMGDAFV